MRLGAKAKEAAKEQAAGRELAAGRKQAGAGRKEAGWEPAGGQGTRQGAGSRSSPRHELNRMYTGLELDMCACVQALHYVGKPIAKLLSLLYVSAPPPHLQLIDQISHVTSEVT